MTAEEFITRWVGSAASERANYQLFTTDLCAFLEVPIPNPSSAVNADNAYVFERSLTVLHAGGSSSTNFIDCYRRGAFILEAKQGSEASAAPQGEALFVAPKGKSGTAKRGTPSWDKAMVKAKAQAEGYARLTSEIEAVYPLSRVKETVAHAELEARGGKIVLSMTP